MKRNALHLGPLLLVLVAACDIITPSADDGGRRRRDDSGPAEPPPLPPCVENRDCRGGELCVVEPDEDTGRCREVCEDDDDCGDAFNATCDRSAGYCVQCVGDEQCDDAEACVDQLCAFFCRKDDDCGGRAFCDEGSGECLDRECSVDNDCSGGFTCEDFRCVSILPLVCTADVIRCVEGGIETCNGDGTAAGVERCADGEGCIDDTDGPRCAALVCVPDEIGCEDNGAAFICDASGTQRTLLPCRSDQYCDAGVCREQVCVPDSAACSGAARVVCDERGATTTAVPCATDSRCADSAFGCACRDAGGDASCVVRVCEPGVGQCVGNGARVCADDGSGFSAVTNCGADECVVGRCLPSRCTPGTTFCSGDALLTCEADGGGYRTTDCADTCAGSDGAAACVARVCEPGSVRCAANNDAVLVCNARGTAETSTACDGGFCASGSCQAQVCEPLARRCGSDTSALVCDALGSAEQVLACGAGESCRGAGVCEPAADPCLEGGIEPDSASRPRSLTTDGSIASGRICASDTDFFRFSVATTTTVSISARFSHTAGDLDIRLRESGGVLVASSAGITDEELIVRALSAGTYTVEVFGFSGAVNTYTIAADQVCSDDAACLTTGRLCNERVGQPQFSLQCGSPGAGAALGESCASPSFFESRSECQTGLCDGEVAGMCTRACTTSEQCGAGLICPGPLFVRSTARFCAEPCINNSQCPVGRVCKLLDRGDGVVDAVCGEPNGSLATGAPTVDPFLECQSGLGLSSGRCTELCNAAANTCPSVMPFCVSINAQTPDGDRITACDSRP